MDTITWWHTFDFEEFKTQGLDNSPEKLKSIQMPEDLTDWSVLDIGAWDGYFSFVAEKRGARVYAMDSLTHSWNPNGIELTGGKKIIQDGKLGFETARKALNSKVIDMNRELDELEHFSCGYDLVLDLGILYHCENPFKHIRDLAKITKKMLILETQTDANYLTPPAMIFYPGNELNNDSGNWWGPNIRCVVEMLLVAGFKDYKIIGIGGNRVVIHAFK